MGNRTTTHKKRNENLSNGKLPEESLGDRPGDLTSASNISNTTDNHTEVAEKITDSAYEEGPPKPCSGVFKTKDSNEVLEQEIPVPSAERETDDYESLSPFDCSFPDEGDTGPTWSFQNHEYFRRGGHGRSSQLTTSSVADSAYTDSTNNTNGCQTCSEDYFCYNCLTCRAQNMDYMTDVYKRTLQRDLRVRDILPDLHFIDDLRKEEILQKSKESRQEAVEMLIETVKSADDEGKWQTFVEALENEGYKFIVKLLKGETENDQEKNKRLLSLMSRQLINNINVDECLDLLYEAELLSDQDKEDIEAEKKNCGPIAAAYKMINIVPSRSADWNEKLQSILVKCNLSEIAKLLKFSSENHTEAHSDQTNLKEYTCSHGASYKKHCTKMDSFTHGDGHHIKKTQEVNMSTDICKSITELSKHVQDLEVKAQNQLSLVTKLEKAHFNDLHEVKAKVSQTADVIESYTGKFSKLEVAQDEIKLELQRQDENFKSIQKQLQVQSDTLTHILQAIKDSVLIHPNLMRPPPEACKQTLSTSSDSGFSTEFASIPEEYILWL